MNGSEPDLTRTKRTKNVSGNCGRTVNLKFFFSLIKCTIVRVRARKQQDTAECSGGEGRRKRNQNVKYSKQVKHTNIHKHTIIAVNCNLNNYVLYGILPKLHKENKTIKR